MPKRPDVWLRRKNGHPDSWYFRKLRLKTKDADEARQRARLSRAGKWPPKEEQAAKVTAEAFTFDPPPAPPASSPSSPPPDPPPASSPPPQPSPGDWTTAAAAASSEARSESAPPPPEPQQYSSEQLADLCVSLQLKATEIYAQQKYYEGFMAPAIAPEGRAMLSSSYRTIFDYAGAAAALPPWVNGLLVPGITVVISSLAIGAGFREIALKQKAEAERSSGGGA